MVETITHERVQALTIPNVRMEDGIPTWHSRPIIPLGAFSLKDVVEAAEEHMDSLNGLLAETKITLVEGEDRSLLQSEENLFKKYPEQVALAISNAYSELTPIVKPILACADFSYGRLDFEFESLHGAGRNTFPHVDSAKPDSSRLISIISAYPRNTLALKDSVAIAGDFPNGIVEKNGNLLTQHYRDMALDCWESFEEQAFAMGEAATMHMKPGYVKRKEGKNFRALLRLDLRFRGFDTEN